MSIEDQIRAVVNDALKTHTALPLFVTQKTVKAVLGIEPRDYLRAAAAGDFPTTKQHRKIIARTMDVVARLERELVVRRDVKPANDADAETVTLSRVGARRVAG